MAVSAWRSAAAAQQPIGGDWSNINNIFSSDDTYADATVDGGVGGAFVDFIAAHDFGFTSATFTANVTITGVEVQIERRTSLASPDGFLDDRISLTTSPGGGWIGGNRSEGAHWGTADNTVEFGSLADDWSASLTSAVIVDSDFGVHIAPFVSAGIATGFIDLVRMRVWYGPPFNYEDTADFAITLQMTAPTDYTESVTLSFDLSISQYRHFSESFSLFNQFFFAIDSTVTIPERSAAAADLWTPILESSADWTDLEGWR